MSSNPLNGDRNEPGPQMEIEGDGYGEQIGLLDEQKKRQAQRSDDVVAVPLHEMVQARNVLFLWT